jgi:Protein of unknown function (DUF2795)
MEESIMTMRGQGGMEGGESMRSQATGMGASQVGMYLKNVNFPANKQKIVEMAKSAGAPENVLQMLNKLPDKQYTQQHEIEQEFSKMR